jgi:paraquat-inducible protein B
MSDIVICGHCGSLNTFGAGMVCVQELDKKTDKPIGEQKSFYLYKCKDCEEYFPRTDIEYHYS